MSVSSLSSFSRVIATMTQGSVQVRKTDDRKSTMSAAAEVLHIRRKAAALVERDYQNTRSWMASYTNIAQAVGTSESWLRKFVKGYAEVKEPGFTVGFNIGAYYDSVCERIEAKNAKRRELIERREGLINALNSGADSGRGVGDPGLVVATPAAPVAPTSKAFPPVTDEAMEFPAFLKREAK